MTPTELRRWRRKRFPSQTEGTGQRLAATWYGVTVRAWQHWEGGTRAIPGPLLTRIKAEAHPGRHH